MPSTKKQIKYIGTKSFEVWRKEKEELCEDLGITNIFKKKTESEMTKHNEINYIFYYFIAFNANAI